MLGEGEGLLFQEAFKLPEYAHPEYGEIRIEAYSSRSCDIKLEWVYLDGDHTVELAGQNRDTKEGWKEDSENRAKNLNREEKEGIRERKAMSITLLNGYMVLLYNI